MKKIFCKIIELENNQVLIQRLSNDEEGEHIIVKSQFEGCMTQMTGSYPPEEAEKADKKFAEFGEKEAKEFIEPFSKMF